jgi:DNA-binding MarR family transcriptional regulator
VPTQTTDVAPASTELAADLRVTIGRMIRRLHQESPVGDFTYSQKAVIGLLERDGASTVTALARAAGVRSQSMGATLAVLKEAGLIAAERHPTDGRQSVLSLTDRAREMLLTGRAAYQDWLARALVTQLTAHEQKQLAAAIPLLDRLLEF